MSVSPPGLDDQARPELPADSYRDAKAAAKAAKVYAKAQRPWYRRKRIIIPLGLVVLAIAGTAVGGGGSDTTGTGSTDAVANSSSGGSGDDGAAGKVGQALTNAGTTYKVTGVETTQTIGDPDLLGARADGVFVVVDLQLTNNKDETKTFLDSSAKIETADGKQYEPSDKALMAIGDESLMLKDIQPDLTTRGKIVFELPPSKASGSTLVIEDLWGSGEVKVDLGS
jgi:hypothetical protein